MKFLIVPEYIKIDVVLRVDPALLVVLQQIAGQTEVAKRLQTATDRLKASTPSLSAAVVANPDPDKTD